MKMFQWSSHPSIHPFHNGFMFPQTLHIYYKYLCVGLIINDGKLRPIVFSHANGSVKAALTVCPQELNAEVIARTCRCLAVSMFTSLVQLLVTVCSSAPDEVIFHSENHKPHGGTTEKSHQVLSHSLSGNQYQTKPISFIYYEKEPGTFNSTAVNVSELDKRLILKKRA